MPQISHSNTYRCQYYVLGKWAEGQVNQSFFPLFFMVVWGGVLVETTCTGETCTNLLLHDFEREMNGGC